MLLCAPEYTFCFVASSIMDRRTATRTERLTHPLLVRLLFLISICCHCMTTLFALQAARHALEICLDRFTCLALADRVTLWGISLPVYISDMICVLIGVKSTIISSIAC